MQVSSESTQKANDEPLSYLLAYLLTLVKHINVYQQEQGIECRGVWFWTEKITPLHLDKNKFKFLKKKLYCEFYYVEKILLNKIWMYQFGEVAM